MRLDVALVGRGLVSTRERAYRLIMAGKVRVDGRVEDKPGKAVGLESVVEVEAETGFVSRGGQKLERALDVFGIDVARALAMDVGASTGGFTDCLLKRGASKVFAVDVGRGQLDARLARDPRVEVLERTNIRYLDPARIGVPLDIITCDVSFISVTLFLDRLMEFLKPGGRLVVLVKPQFEAGPSRVGRGGVVRRPEAHEEVLDRVTRSAVSSGYEVVGLTHSPVRGPKGNIEYLLALARRAGAGGRVEDAAGVGVAGVDIPGVVGEAWRVLVKPGEELRRSP